MLTFTLRMRQMSQALRMRVSRPLFVLELLEDELLLEFGLLLELLLPVLPVRCCVAIGGSESWGGSVAASLSAGETLRFLDGG